MAELTAIELCELNRQFDALVKRAGKLRGKVEAHRGNFVKAVEQAKDIDGFVGLAVIYYHEEGVI